MLSRAQGYAGFPLPGEGYDGYETYNRLMPVVSLLLVAGLAGLHAAQREAYGRRRGGGFVASFVGAALMVLGDAAEFWLFTTQTHAAANGRLRGGSSCWGCSLA
ncbi:MAG: hypothetical protein M3151_02210 [Actinomycetota bacterium]|nr:hypothetical protein [Actinomycetota bacterium]